MDWIILAHDRVQCRVRLDITVELRVVQMARNYWRILLTIRGIQILNQKFNSFSLHEHRFQIFLVPFMVITIARRCCRLVFHHPHHITRSLLTASACPFTACFLLSVTVTCIAEPNPRRTVSSRLIGRNFGTDWVSRRSSSLASGTALQKSFRHSNYAAVDFKSSSYVLWRVKVFPVSSGCHFSDS